MNVAPESVRTERAQPAPVVAQPASEFAGTPRGASFFETLKAVSWSFFGVRARRSHERDMARLNPLYVILMGVLLAVVFVLSLITIVKFVVS